MTVMLRLGYGEGTYQITDALYRERLTIERERWNGIFGDMIEVKTEFEKEHEKRMVKQSDRVLSGEAAERTE